MEGKYNHLDVQAGKSKEWRKKAIFTAGDLSKEPFTIVMPPPNITSKLHIGHALDLTLQDVIIRYKRMVGYDALWLPGMDHAGIATQAKVDEKLKADGTNRFEIGREAFLQAAWEWKLEHEELIRQQWELLGFSLDYSRECFTMDEHLSKTVSTVFKTMYDKGLIYRGKQIINFDPKAKTALSNIEVIHKDVNGFEYYFKYLCVEDPTIVLEVMTTRPETMFGDGALAVHPEDERYESLVGKHFIVPNTNTQIPLIQDEYVQIDKGSGVVKITMAHDPNDYEVALRHNMQPRIIMELDGTMSKSEFVPKLFQGLDRFEARKQQVELAKQNGLLIKAVEIVHSVGHSERTGVVVEPFLSKQWFVKMDELAHNILSYQKTEQKVNFIPSRNEKIFTNWMSNINDWCISRQLWWGHRIPAWYNGEEVFVGETSPSSEWVQDEDVLDTWFSSALWPFSTLGWLDNSKDYERYYPTNTLVTAYDIIFFWVSRMMFQGLEFTDTKPFNEVVIHGLIRDSQGRKMSKSLGNGIDPLELVKKYGSDSLRWYLTTSVTQGMDLSFQEEKLEASWNFMNKLWNASRYIKMQLGESFSCDTISNDLLTLSDKWILKRLNAIIEEVNRNMENYEFVVVGSVLYDFIWNDFCNWYLEFSKVNLNSDDKRLVVNTKQVLSHTLVSILKLIHPFVPFITEEIYSEIYQTDNYLALQDWPQINSDYATMDIAINETIIELITKIRNLRVEKQISNKISFPITIEVSQADLAIFTANQAILNRFMNSDEITITTNFNSNQEVLSFILHRANMYVILADITNKDEEVARLQAQINNVNAEIKRAKAMLSNENFINKAPQAKVTLEQEKLQNYEQQLQELEDNLNNIR